MQAELILSKYDQTVQSLAYELSAFIISEQKEIKEQVDLPANMIAYGYGNTYKEMICTIILSKKGIKLGINRGTELPDPAGLLSGTGKLHKYVEIKSSKDIHNPALRALLKEAFKAYLKRMDKK
ncbi:MAG TPA: DUF1801 domain-containing protein [Saprospiraceae bacterium]|nr:DUF1801 domain-containing protein [Saprospiraceae bacterium]